MTDGEKPFTTPSQVFYTTTGLRAVDPDSAKTSCPLAHIGPLRRGHVIYRLTGNPDDYMYDAVEIRSIEVGHESEQTVYSVSLWAGEQSHHANGYLLAINNPNVSSSRILLPSLICTYRLSIRELSNPRPVPFVPFLQRSDSHFLHHFRSSVRRSRRTTFKLSTSD